MLCPGMSGYLNDQFDRAALTTLPHTGIAPLTLIDIEHFEDLLPDIKQFGFGALLDDYRAYLPSAGHWHDQLISFRRKNIPFLHDKPDPPDKKEAAFRQLLDDLGARLFANASVS